MLVSRDEKGQESPDVNAQVRRERFVLPEDLAVVLSVRIHDNEMSAPSFSLDPADPLNPSGPETKAVHMPAGRVANTFLGQMLFEADYALKMYNFGVTVGADGQLARRHTSEYEEFKATTKIRADRLAAEAAAGSLDAEKLKDPQYNRKWIVAAKQTVEEQGDTLHFKEAVMDVETRVMIPDPTSRMGLRDVESATDEDSNEFCRRFKAGYAKLAAESPQLGHVQEMSKLVQLADWIEERGWGINLARLEALLGQEAHPCPTTAMIRTIEDVQRSDVGPNVLKQLLYGGVDLGAVRAKEQLQAADHAAVLAAGKYTAGSTGANALAALKELDALIESMPEDSPEALELKGKLRAEVAAAYKQLHAGVVPTDADIAALGARISGIAKAAEGKDLPPDAEVLRLKIAGLGGALGSAEFAAAAAGAGPAAESARLAALGAGALAAAVAAKAVADKPNQSKDAQALQGDIKAVLAKHGNLLDPELAARATPEEVQAFIKALELAKERHALSSDPDTLAAVAEIERITAKLHPEAIAAAAAVAAAAAAVAAGNRSRNDGAVASLSALTKSEYSNDPDDAAAVRVALAELLAKGPGSTPEETDAWLAEVRKLIAKNTGVPGASEELDELVAAAALALAAREAAVAGRSADGFIAQAKRIGDPAVFPSGKSKEAADFQAEIARLTRESEARVKATGKPASPEEVATLRAGLHEARLRHKPAPGHVPHPQFADIDAALAALLATPLAAGAGTITGPEFYRRAKHLAAEPAAGDKAKVLKLDMEAAVGRTKLLAPGGNPTGDEVALLHSRLGAVAAFHAAETDPEAAALHRRLLALLDARVAGMVLAPQAFILRANEIADPKLTPDGGSAAAAALQERVRALAGNPPLDPARAKPEDVAILRGQLAELSRQAAAGAAAGDRGLAGVRGAIEALLATPALTATPGDGSVFVRRAERLAAYDVGGCPEGTKLRADISRAVEDAKAKHAQLPGGKDAPFSRGEVDALAAELQRALAAHTPADGASYASSHHRDLAAALAGLLGGRSLPGDGVDANAVRAELKRIELSVPAEARDDAHALAVGAAKVRASISPSATHLGAGEALAVAAQIRALLKANELGGGSSDHARAAFASLEALAASLETQVRAQAAMGNAARTAGLASILGGALSLGLDSFAQEVSLGGGLKGSVADLLRPGQYARGTLTDERCSKRGGEHTRFGNNPRFLAVAVRETTAVQFVLTIDKASVKKDFGKPMLYVYQSDPAFPPHLEWWDKNKEVKCTQRVSGAPIHGKRVVRVDATLEKGKPLILIPAVEIPSDLSFTITCHSYGPVHLTPVVWVPKENSPAQITTVGGEWGGITADVTLGDWRNNAQVRVTVHKPGTRLYCILRKHKNDDVAMRLDHARNAPAHEASSKLEVGFDRTGDATLYQKLPDILLRLDNLQPGNHFLVPSTQAGMQGRWRLEIWGPPGSYTAAKGESKDSGNIKVFKNVEHDPKKSPSSVGPNGHITY